MTGFYIYKTGLKCIEQLLQFLENCIMNKIRLSVYTNQYKSYGWSTKENYTEFVSKENHTESILRSSLRCYCTKFEKRIYLSPSSDVLALIEVEFPVKFPATSRSVKLYSVYGDKFINNPMFPMPITDGKLRFLKPSLLSI